MVERMDFAAFALTAGLKFRNEGVNLIV